MKLELPAFRPEPPSFLDRWFYWVLFASLSCGMAVPYVVNAYRWW